MDSLRTKVFLLVACLSAYAPSVRSSETPDPEETPADVPATTPSEPSKKEAAERFRRGLEFYEEGEFTLALIEFERAYQLVPDHRVLFNISQVSIQIGKFARARHALEQYARLGSNSFDSARREQVDKDLKMLVERTATLGFSGAPPDTELFVDDELVGKFPLAAPLLLDAGEHKIAARKAGYEDLSQRITLAGAEERVLTLTLKSSAVAPRPVVAVAPRKEVPPPLAPDPATNKATLAWIGTGVLGGATFFAGVMGMLAANDLEQLKDDPSTTETERQGQANTVNSWWLATDILGATAIASAGLAVYFTLSEEPAPNSSAALRLKVSSGGVDLSGTF